MTVDLTEVPVADSYCQFVVRDGVYWTQDSLIDPMLAGPGTSTANSCAATSGRASATRANRRRAACVISIFLPGP